MNMVLGPYDWTMTVDWYWITWSHVYIWYSFRYACISVETPHTMWPEHHTSGVMGSCSYHPGRLGPSRSLKMLFILTSVSGLTLWGRIRGTAELHRPPGSSSCTAKSALMTRESHRLHHFAIVSLPHSPSIYLVDVLISGFLSFCGHKIHVTSLMARYSIRVVCPCSWFCSNSCLAQNKLFSFLIFHLLISMYVLVCVLTPQHICGVSLWEPCGLWRWARPSSGVPVSAFTTWALLLTFRINYFLISFKSVIILNQYMNGGKSGEIRSQRQLKARQVSSPWGCWVLAFRFVPGRIFGTTRLRVIVITMQTLTRK